ncbi:uncharacterized protein LOC123412298 [Hordeum vulgare subsp. vulgare]|uniref:Uncharacterized protein n=1 Tax=Hordeum vulgare subsp. vulgare TaxID=112509 RepID=A0A8I6YRM8_HORVV|nr:uncharacterized protein LOC123412298 [Hordeum vulgare subsp. vulgare]
MEDARGYRGIPAFGEWNYDDYGDDWSVLTQRFESAMNIPLPVHKPCKRARAGRRRRVPAFGEWNNHGDGDGDGHAGGWTAAVVNQQAHKPLKQEFTSYDDSGVFTMGKQRKLARQTWVDDSGSNVAMEPFSFTTDKGADDDDLYEVPPDMLCSKPLRKSRTWLRSLLIRCCGLNCLV